MWKESKVRGREKSGAAKPAAQRAPQATAEQMRIAQLVDDQNEDDIQTSKNVSKIVEITGVSEEKALLALYDSNDDPSRAIELLLEKQTQGEDNGWETAGRRKNRGGNSITRNTDTFDDDAKDENSIKNKSDRNTTGKGRGRKGRNFDQNRPGPEDHNKENENIQTAKDRRPGRGRSRSGPNRGRGRGAPRHSRNRALGGKNDDNSGKFGTPNTLDEPVEMWESTSVKCWDIEVGTWSSKDAHKQDKSGGDSYPANWGTESWADDLSESRVFQAQPSTAVEKSDSTTGATPVKGDGDTSHDRIANTGPQTGERIDLGLLFKKSSDMQNQAMPGRSNYGGFVSMGHDKPAHGEIRTQSDVSGHVQDFQQHSQMKAPFGETNVAAPTVTSRLFSDYEQTQHTQQSVSGSLFQSDDTSNLLKNSYSQLNGNLHNQSKESSFLESFSGIGSNTNQEAQSDILGQLNGLANTRSQLPPYSQLRIPIGKDSSLSRQNTGNPVQTTESTVTNLDSLSKNRVEDHLSFGSPLPPQINQQSRQQRKKMPNLPSKIPASAVEMPGNKGYGTQDYSPFSLQFGVDEPASISDLANHDYGVTIPHSISPGIITQQNALFLNGDSSIKTSNTIHSANNSESLFNQNLQSSTPTNVEKQELEERSKLPGLDHSIKVPPGLTMPSTSTSSTSVTNNNVAGGQHGSNFLSRNDDQGPGRPHDSSYRRPSSLNSSFSQEVPPYYVASTSSHTSQSPKMIPGANNPGQQLHANTTSSGLPENLTQNKPTQSAGDNSDKYSSSTLESSSNSISSLAAGLSQVSIPQSIHGQGGEAAVSHSAMTSLGSSGAVPPSPYSSAVSTSERVSSPGTNQAPVSRKTGYNTVQNQAPSSSYDESLTNSMQNRTSVALSPLPHSMQQTSTVDSTSNQSAFKILSSATSPSGLGGLAAAKMPPVAPNKGNINVPSGLTTPIQYGIPMPGLMPYAAAPDMPYPYDQLLLAQSRVVNPLHNIYDMNFHGHTQAGDAQDSSASIGQNLPGHGKYNRNDASSSTPPTQMNMPGTVGSELSQHNTSIPMQPVPPKAVTQSSGHHAGQQQYVGAMPAYHNYSSLAAPYYSLGMANAGFQYPATMFAAAAMPQAPKHTVSTADGFQQPSGRYNHTSATSSSGLSDLSRPNYPKTHPSALDKQQGYHQHTNTPPPFNLQTITAAVAGGGAATGNTAPGLGPYAAPPYMALLPTHQQQTMHLLQHQHQDPTSGHPVGSQRNLGSSSIVKPTKRGGYGSATSSYWGN